MMIQIDKAWGAARFDTVQLAGMQVMCTRVRKHEIHSEEKGNVS